MILDNIIFQLFGYCENPVEVACRFMIVILIIDGIFGAVSALLRVNRFD